MEAGDLLFASIAQGKGLQGAGAHGEHRVEGIALAKQELAFLQRAAALDDAVQRVHVFEVQRQGQAQGGEAAVLAMGLVLAVHLDEL